MHRLVLACIFVLGATRLDACVCVTGSLRCAFKAHEAVFVGKVKAVRTSETVALHTIEVVDALKGTRAGEELVVETDAASSCGFQYREGEVALVLAGRTPRGTLEAGYCAHFGHNNPQGIATAKRRAWWYRLGISSLGCPRRL
jgi:predicted Zn-ribbon and HTH transcriptional regulator